MNMNDYHCGGVAATFKVTQRLLRPSFFLPHLQIKFNFSFKMEHLIYILDRQFSLIFTSWNDSSSATVAVGASLSFEDVAAAVENCLLDKDLDDESRRKLIKCAREEVLKEFPKEKTLPNLKILDVCFDVKIKYHYDFVKTRRLSGVGCGRADDDEEEEKCCICLQEVAGGDRAFWMPCSHVFHGGCIKEWRRRSSSCPLCRCEMPKI